MEPFDHNCMQVEQPPKKRVKIHSMNKLNDYAALELPAALKQLQMLQTQHFQPLFTWI